jgi:hypothetical protein
MILNLVCHVVRNGGLDFVEDLHLKLHSSCESQLPIWTAVAAVLGELVASAMSG